MIIPSLWKVFEVEEQKLIVGILEDNGYEIYVADIFSNEVWRQRRSQDEVIKVLNTKGYDDIENDALEYVMNILIGQIRKGSWESVSKTDSQVTITIRHEDKGEGVVFEWMYELLRMEPLDQADFCNQLMMQQLNRVYRLKTRKRKAIEIISLKNHYIRYLTENYKAINGSDVLEKYGKNNSDIIEAIESFENENENEHDDEDEDEDEKDLSPGELLNVIEDTNDSQMQYISPALASPRAKRVKTSSGSRKSSQKSPTPPPVKQEPMIKQEPIKQEPMIKQEQTELNGSPKRHRRKGIISRKHK